MPRAPIASTCEVLFMKFLLFPGAPRSADDGGIQYAPYLWRVNRALRTGLKRVRLSSSGHFGRVDFRISSPNTPGRWRAVSGAQGLCTRGLSPTRRGLPEFLKLSWGRRRNVLSGKP